jgi:hypothetical protein
MNVCANAFTAGTGQPADPVPVTVNSYTPVECASPSDDGRLRRAASVGVAFCSRAIEGELLR